MSISPVRTTLNFYKSLVIDIASVDRNPDGFTAQLSEAIREWETGESPLVWLELPRESADLVPVAVACGFEYHSVTENGLMLYLRIHESAYVPYPATHYIGAGGVVLRNDRDLLVVSERYRRSENRHLKLPGGALQPGEHIVDAVCREVREETGIDTRFRGLVCFRHWHGYRHGKSDIYFVCRLEPVSYDISRQVDEIDDCFWMPVEEFLEADDVHPFNKRIVRAALHGDGIAPEDIPGYGTPETHEFFMPPGD